ncbi:MAG TPA: NAD-dependent epimerase/dehydratase family protein [Thermoplasmata archaeon]
MTGCAGFIGARTAIRFLSEGSDVIGIDNFDPYYSREAKEANLSRLEQYSEFKFVEGDLNEIELDPILGSTHTVIHLAAQPGVRASWGDGFSRYLRNNVLTTHRLLDRCSSIPLRSFVYASSASVYGQPSKLPVEEDDPTDPISPYGLTKLFAEHLCVMYQGRFRAPIARLRYFTVYGPGQRPDMLIHRAIDSALRGLTLEIFGDGRQKRDFTFVEDVAQANWLAATKLLGPFVSNIASGRPVSVNKVLDLIEEETGGKIQVRHLPRAEGDPQETVAATKRASATIDFRVMTPLKDGIHKQVEWQRALEFSGWR